jgi:HEAT repeat protein
LLSCAILFFGGLSLLKKTEPGILAAKLTPIDLLLNETKKEEESAQLDGVTHLGDMHDPRIVPALTALLSHTTSEQVVEAIAEALGKQRDPRAIPSLRHAAQQKYDDFLKYSIARSQLALDDSQGFETLIAILKDDEGGFARQQANELLETKAVRKFGYHPDQSVAANRAALERIEAWRKTERDRMK